MTVKNATAAFKRGQAPIQSAADYSVDKFVLLADQYKPRVGRTGRAPSENGVVSVNLLAVGSTNLRSVD